MFSPVLDMLVIVYLRVYQISGSRGGLESTTRQSTKRVDASDLLICFAKPSPCSCLPTCMSLSVHLGC